MKKIYTVSTTMNGFIIELDHLKCSFEHDKLFIARTLDEVIEVLREDLEKKEVSIEKEILKQNEIKDFIQPDSTYSKPKNK